LNLSHFIGTIEVGKKADVNLAGVENPLKGVVFHATNADVEIVMGNGEIVKECGKRCKVPWAPVAENLKMVGDALIRDWRSFCSSFLKLRMRPFCLGLSRSLTIYA